MIIQSHVHLLNASQIGAFNTRNKNSTISSSSSFTPSFHKIVLTLSKKYKTLHRTLSLQVIKAQSFRDEGRQSNNVTDASLRILRERIEEVRNKERLERCCSRSEIGWNYDAGYNSNYKRETILSQCFDSIGLIAGTAGLTIVSGTFFLCLVSIILHLNQ